jgi:hypothetical protein
MFQKHTPHYRNTKSNLSLNKRNYSTMSNNNQLGPYLAGLIEGDGSILVPSKEGKWLPYIEIVFDIKDFKLIQKIQSILGGGYITIRPNGNSGRLTIKKKDILLNLILLINGHMRTPKMEALHRLIEWFNNKYDTNIPLLGMDTEPLNNSSWLSGFLEADGSFYFNYKLNKDGIPIGIVYYLRISQKQTYNRKVDSSVNMSNLPHMQLIADLFKAKITNIERVKDKYIERAYEVRTDKIESKIMLFDYLNKFPLFGYKYFAHTNLEILHNLVLKKEHKLTDGKDKIILHKDLMKYNDTNNWNHLNNFYIK